MTDAERWEAAKNPRQLLALMLVSLIRQKESGHHRCALPRTWRLLACAIARMFWPSLVEHSRGLIEGCERYADELQRLKPIGVFRMPYSVFRMPYDDLDAATRQAVYACLHAASADDLLVAVECRSVIKNLSGRDKLIDFYLTRRVHCVMGNPFRPLDGVIRSEMLSADDYRLVKMSLAILEESHFDLMPVLADALEDAGCDDPLVLRHCRHGGPHFRGCHVLDALTGR